MSQTWVRYEHCLQPAHDSCTTISLVCISKFLGGRLGFGKVLEPSNFANIGLDTLSSAMSKQTAATLEAGAAFDFTLLPVIDLGAHASYNALLPRENYGVLDVALEF